MQFSVFQEQLAKVRPGASAHLDADGRVCVAFEPGGKVYTYRGSVYEVAERLGLIPDIDIPIEAQRIIEAFRSGAERVYGYLVAADTVRWYWQHSDTCIEHCGAAGTDGFDRDLTVYRLVNRSDDPWLA